MKLAYSLVVLTRKLLAYFESYQINVYTNSPLRQVFHKPDMSRRMRQWSTKLVGFELNFLQMRAIKA